MILELRRLFWVFIITSHSSRDSLEWEEKEPRIRTINRIDSTTTYGWYDRFHHLAVTEMDVEIC